VSAAYVVHSLLRDMIKPLVPRFLRVRFVRFLCLAALSGMLYCSSQNSWAQDQQPQADSTTQETSAKSESSKGAIVGAPIPISSPAIGSGAVPVAAYIFPFSKNDQESPPSVIGVAGLLTNNGSRGFALGGDFYLKQNRIHMTSIYFRGNLNYDFYGVGVDSGDSGGRLPLKQTGQVFFGEFLYRIGWKFFFGPRILTGNSTLTLRPNDGSSLPPPPDISLNTALTGIGFRLNRDTRPNRFYPTRGTFFDFNSTFFGESLGSKYTFQSYRTTFNAYRSFGDSQVLAYNLFVCATGGDAPFYAECIYGTNNQLRGYVAGQHIDRYMVATQAEYRLTLPWRFGAVFFGGLGAVAPSVANFRYRNILPAGGGGIRFKLSKKYNVNLRVDIAQGRDGHTFSMGIGEAF